MNLCCTSKTLPFKIDIIAPVIQLHFLFIANNLLWGAKVLILSDHIIGGGSV